MDKEKFLQEKTDEFMLNMPKWAALFGNSPPSLL